MWASSHGFAPTDIQLQSRNYDTFFSSQMSPSMLGSTVPDSSNFHSASDKHPNFWHLNVLVFGAVLEVVCVSLPGYIIARQGMFDAESQKFLANLNVMLFTPCLIWTKLASQLTPDKLTELAIIPVIFGVQTFVSYFVSRAISKAFGFKKRPQNFVTAMGVFGNSNSLPISLIISLSKTLPGLHWDKIKHDNDDEVAARGILYLLIFQQLGQLVRWSWGYHVLLAPPEKFTVEEGGTANGQMEDGRHGQEEASSDERTGLLVMVHDEDEESTQGEGSTGSSSPSGTRLDPNTWSGADTPMNRKLYTSSSTTLDELHTHLPKLKPTQSSSTNPTVQDHPDSPSSSETDSELSQDASLWTRTKQNAAKIFIAIGHSIASISSRIFASLPQSVQSVLSRFGSWSKRFFLGVWDFMNPPLWAMLIAIVVASVPKLQHLFFTKGTFLNTSVTRAIEQSGGVAVPLILVVLGANLARNTLPQAQLNAEDPKLEKKLLIAAILSRMLLPTLIMAPFLAILAKFAPVSIVDDPVFVVVCFLLTGAPSALQLAQICQLNNVYVGAMTKLLFQSYVIWILPSTLILVVMAIEVVKWAAV
ncbi:auxin efflux carrier [Microthyrium microscopicum]|uniref:Auxin efflux carrier n=1 Tax=Microthyrium microscopicum TaxID=703497 RepID=A0A6A6UQ41_9PEZI|nr:auxin efflux carrier [Microthyrium microscopicum]